MEQADHYAPGEFTYAKSSRLIRGIKCWSAHVDDFRLIEQSLKYIEDFSKDAMSNVTSRTNAIIVDSRTVRPLFSIPNGYVTIGQAALQHSELFASIYLLFLAETKKTSGGKRRRSRNKLSRADHEQAMQLPREFIIWWTESNLGREHVQRHLDWVNRNLTPQSGGIFRRIRFIISTAFALRYKREY